ncbi:permease component of ABC-type sugar transporter [Sphaerochaeta pleomorpha str. Grapes]|uniref:Permease component of ABC-type sugar transporter n=1 Tax=Sphaerochaeta pleomorpha (strain ATCC BAA-1885 / DSM 22778 / Grapes) TaxID=158190 RepID=G8QXC0_SPHPG|nr:sugar ABC transporter permease [Sphaerochaeta pleomorpha]AEV28421.1 permease component of ABC-type sugar transporter [Sphaerochaeta pleomorpha str. Grapes]
MNTHKTKTWAGYVFISPFFIIFLIFIFYPALYTLFLSFKKWDGLTSPAGFGSFNFRRLIFDKVFYLSLGNTFRIWVCNFIPQMLSALLLSFFFTFNKVKGMKFLRAAYYLPNLITATSVGLLFNLLFNGKKSAVNQILASLGISGAPFSFFNSELFTSSLVSYIQWWMWFGYTTVIIMAGITSIDAAVYEAARVDGATKMQTYLHITMPLIRPTLLYMTITSIIGGMQLFDVPVTLSNGMGDPRKAVLTTPMYLYNQGFASHNYGYASALSIGLFLIIALLSFLAFRAMRHKENVYAN